MILRGIKSILSDAVVQMALGLIAFWFLCQLAARVELYWERHPNLFRGVVSAVRPQPDRVALRLGPRTFRDRERFISDRL